MNRELLTFVILLSVAALAVSAFSTHRSQDEVAIHKVETGLQEAWNHHDAKAFASFFTEDADCVNVVGWWWKGRPQIEKKVADAHVFMFRESTLTDD
jgi:ketosteroid isomerase-like protein